MIKIKNQEKNKFILAMKFITIFIFIFFNSNFAIAKIEDCKIIKDELKKKNCVINNKAENAIILIGSTNMRWKLVVNAWRMLATSLTTIEVSSPLLC